MRSIIFILALTQVAQAETFFWQKNEMLYTVPKKEAVRILVQDEKNEEVVYKCQRIMLDPDLRIKTKKVAHGGK
jgi:hypothetical protein